MRSTRIFAALMLSIACVPSPWETTAYFSPPAITLDPELPEQSYRLRLCWSGNAGEYPTASLAVLASGTTPVPATVLVEHHDNEPVPITATDPDEAVGSRAVWRDEDVDDACETGAIVTFALDEPADGLAEIEWLVGARVYSFEEKDAELLTLEVHVEALD